MPKASTSSEALEHRSSDVDLDVVLDSNANEFELALNLSSVVDLLLHDDRYKEKNVQYPRSSWSATVCAITGRSQLGVVFWALVIECILVVTIFHGLELQNDFVDTVRNLPSTPLKILGTGLMFLVVFHTQTSYQKWVLSRKIWQDLTVISRDLAMQSVSYMDNFDSACRMCRYLVIYVLSVRCWLRSEELSNELVQPITTPAGFKYVMETCSRNSKSGKSNTSCAPLACLEILREILERAVESKAIAPFHMAFDANIKALGSSLGNAEKILNTQIPFAYISQVRTTVLIYVALMPFFLIKELGWFTIVCVAFFAYVLVGLENLASEIENPFGYDANDLPLDLYCARIATDINDILTRRRAVVATLNRLDETKDKDAQEASA